MTPDERYMRRALELAAHGLGRVSPNPMVGAVIVGPDGSIIGEGYHRRLGEGHAEVNAVASVADREALRRSTMYVTLEPCSHFGKTPPCARLLIDCGVPRVVVGAMDPNPKVSGRGVAMLREAGAEVVTGVLADESRRLNAAFMTAHELRRPFVTLKWAQSADGFMDSDRPEGHAEVFSTPLTSMLVHRLRSLHDAILAGSGTVLADRPRLDCRLWPGRSPRPVVADRRRRLSAADLGLMADPLVLDTDPGTMLAELYSRHGVTSVLVEGGAELLGAFLREGLWDCVRVETSPRRLGARGRTPAPAPTATARKASRTVDGNRIDLYSGNPLVDPFRPL